MAGRLGQSLYLGKKSVDGKTVYLVIIISDKKQLYSIETIWLDSLEEGTVSVSHDALKNKIDSEDKVVLDGIFFETGKDVVTAESKSSLSVIADYLNGNSGKAFYVVGHTDDTGSLGQNIHLSEKGQMQLSTNLKHWVLMFRG